MPDQAGVIALIFVPLFAGGMAIWAWVLTRASRGQPILRYEPRTSVPWTGVDVLVLVIIWLVLQAVAVRTFAWLSGSEMVNDGADPQRLLLPSIVGSSVGNALAMFVIVAWLMAGRGATLADLGLVARPRKDFALGIGGFAAASVIIYPLMLLLTKWIEYDHPIMRAVELDPAVDVLIIATLSAVIVAPITEELIFRVLFQGWLERKRRAWRNVHADMPHIDRHSGPVLISAAVFGIAHYGNGPAPIPLFILGLFLGYLYERTHRLLPCVILHVCVNALTTVQLWLNHFYPPPAP